MQFVWRVKNKTRTSLSLISSIPNEIIGGQTLTISVILRNESNSLGIQSEWIKFSFVSVGGQIGDSYALTNSEGKATVEVKIPTSITSFDIIILYEGSEEINQTTYYHSTSVSVVSMTQYILRYVLWIAIGAGIIVAVIVIYKYGVYSGSSYLLAS